MYCKFKTSLANYYDWSTLEDGDWKNLLHVQPQLAKFKS